MQSGRTLRLATRRSALALWQARHVAAMLTEAAGAAEGGGLEVELVELETSADRRQDVQIWEIGGKGAFVKEVQAAILDGRADLAVHSAKDLPSTEAEGLTIAAVPSRADPRDVLVGSTLEGLAPGAVVATGSVRRRAQLASLRPDLTFRGLRGNIATRLGRIPPGGAVVVAAAALERLGTSVEVHEVLDPAHVLPQAGQGSLAVECGEADEELVALLGSLDDPRARAELDAERSYLAALGGDCDLPAGALARTLPDGGLTLEVLLASLDGHVVMRHSEVGRSPAELGLRAADHLLERCGGRSLLAS